MAVLPKRDRQLPFRYTMWVPSVRKVLLVAANLIHLKVSYHWGCRIIASLYNKLFHRVQYVQSAVFNFYVFLFVCEQTESRALGFTPHTVLFSYNGMSGFVCAVRHVLL